MRKTVLFLLCSFVILSTAVIANSTDSGKVEALKMNSSEAHQAEQVQKISTDNLQKIKKELERKENQTKVEEKNSWLYITLMYIPNRIIDLTDIITMQVGFGPEVSAEVMATQYFQFGIDYGDKYFLEKGYNRQYGGGYHSGSNASFICWSDQVAFTDFTFGSVEPYVILPGGDPIPCPCKKPYSNGLKDFWQIGIHLGWIIDVDVAIHPVAIANFFTGFALVRLTDTREL